MELGSITVTAPPALQRRRFSMELRIEGSVFHCVLVLACALFCLATCKPCLLNSMQQSVANDACGPCLDDPIVGSRDNVAVDAGSELAAGGSIPQINSESICSNPHLFCFPSTLTGSSIGEKTIKTAHVVVSNDRPDCSMPSGSSQDFRWGNRTWPSGMGVFKILNDQTVSCSLNSREGSANSDNIREDFEQSVGKQHEVLGMDHAFLSQCPRHANKQIGIRTKKISGINKAPPVDVHPPILDWGEKHIYSVSLAILTVANTCNESILTIYEPFSSNSQFYPCNFNGVSLGPGEEASLCFVFAPRSLGFTSGQVMLQTSSGGFFIEVKGLAVESPYNISPLLSSLVPHIGRESWHLSLFNPYDENVHVKEVSAWMLASKEKISHQTEATCWLENSKNPDGDSPIDDLGDWFILGNSEADYPLMALRPRGNWEVGAHHSETIMEIDFSYGLQGQMLGAFCIHLLSPSLNMSDTIIVPVEVDTHTNLNDSGTQLVSVSLEILHPHSRNATLVAITIKNRAPYMLHVEEITEVAANNIFHFKYINGLLLFPGSATQVAVIACNQLLSDLVDSQPNTANTEESCKLVVLTNDSRSPPAELPCQDIIDICWRHHEDSSVRYRTYKTPESDYKISASESSGAHLSSSIKAWGAVEAGEVILESWKSQGSSGVSVLDVDEISFPTVQVGTHLSRWISMKNPSEEPVVMQLILNSGEIVDECSADDGFLQPSETRNGFSVAEGAMTEAYVHPHAIVSFGPIVFNPMRQCRWRSSALVRNNLSGVEWLSLTGFGGSFNLVLFEGSEPIQSIEFGLDLPTPLNISPNMLFHGEKSALSCSVPLSKEIHAKNLGNMPLEVERIEVSGARCGSDGFAVSACEGFSLQPGESKQLFISYQTDFSAPNVHRDLQLALPSGLIVVPMKASLPLYMLNLCWKSVVWARLKKSAGVFLLAAFFILLIIFYVPPQLTEFNYEEHSRNDDNISPGTVQVTEKTTSHVPRDRRSSKLSSSPHLGSLLGSPGKGELFKDGKYPKNRAPAQERSVVHQNVTPSHGNQEHFVPIAEQTASVLPSLLSNSPAAKSPGTHGVSPPESCNLTVRIGKEKGRRRRKRRGPNGGLNMIEVSSSHSGNSTPSSPLSPRASTTPGSSWSPSPDMDHSEVASPFSRAFESKATLQELKASANHRKDDSLSASEGFTAAASMNANGKPVLLPSGTLPGTSRLSLNPLHTSCSLASTSAIAPHARAPGSKLCNQKAVSLEDKVGGDRYRYDIWGDHISGLNLTTGCWMEVPAMTTDVSKSDSNSFFVRGPQALMTMSSQPKYASCFRHDG